MVTAAGRDRETAGRGCGGNLPAEIALRAYLKRRAAAYAQHAERAGGVGGGWALKRFGMLLAGAFSGVALGWLAPGWWPVGVVLVGLWVAITSVKLRAKQRGGPSPVWRATYVEPPWDDLPPHAAHAVREARERIKGSRWCWPGIHVHGLRCEHQHAPGHPCTEKVCTSVSVLGPAPPAIIVVGQYALAGASDDHVRTRLLRTAEHLRSWRPVARALAGPLLWLGPALVVWALPLFGLATVPAVLLGVYSTVVCVCWMPAITADHAAARSCDPRDLAAVAVADQRRHRVAMRRAPRLARAAEFLLPCSPPAWMRRRLANNRFSRRRYYRHGGRRRDRPGSP